MIATQKLNLGHGDESVLLTLLTEDERGSIESKFGNLFFTNVLKGIHTTAGIVHAKSIDTGKDIIVANTHLFFHPFGGHIRILQGLCLMRKLSEMRQQFPNAGVIVCGDFNSRPDSGSFKVMRSGSIKATHEDWQYGRSFRAERYTESTTPPADDDDEAAIAVSVSLAELPPVEGIDVSHPLVISHVPSKIPELTHATAAFRSTLDYIFYTADVFEAVEGEGTGSSIPEFTNAEADAMGGLPYDYYGSDHVLVCGDVRIR